MVSAPPARDATTMYTKLVNIYSSRVLSMAPMPSKHQTIYPSALGGGCSCFKAWPKILGSLVLITSLMMMGAGLF